MSNSRPRLVSIALTPPDVERKPTHGYARVSVDRAMLVAGHGMKGDLKAGKGRRQINLMFAEIVAELAAEGRKTRPGELGEQIVIAGLDSAVVVPITRIRLGDTAEIEVTLPRTGCGRFEQIQGTTKEQVAGRLGVLARVVTGGEIAVGDPVYLSATSGTV